jgi:tellurite resistance protein
MTKDAFKDRERAAEEGYFRKSDERLLEKLRENARLEEVVAALRDLLQVQNPELLQRVRALGITAETATAFILAPLVQVAWAEGKVTEKERETVFRLAAARGIASGSPAQVQLDGWLQTRPSDVLFQTAIEVIKAGLDSLPKDEREKRIAGIVQACRDVSEASGGLAKTLGIGSGVSSEESSVLDAVTAALRA